MAGCGFTPAVIDAMPMQDVLALCAHWREHPPVHEVLAAVCGVRAAATPSDEDPSGIGALMARAPDGHVDMHPRDPPARGKRSLAANQ